MIEYASAFIVSAIICAICAFICIIFTSYTFNQIIKNDAFNSYSADNVIHLTLVTLVVFSIQTTIGTFDPIMKLEENEDAVNTVASVSVNLFMLGRFLTTLLFVKRLQFIFKDSLIAYNNCIIRTMYGMLITEFIFIIITSFAITINEFNEAANEWDNLLYIFAGFVFYLLDTILVIWLPYLFIRKLYELIPSNYMMKQHLNENQHNNHNHNEQDINNNNDKQITQHSRQTESGKYDGVQLSVNVTNGDNNHDNASKKEEISKIEPSNNKDSHNSNEDNNNNNNNNNKKDESAKHGSQSQASIQSIPVIGITKENAPVYKMNGNDYKYEQIINTATRITLLSCICCFSSIILIILSSLASNNIPARAIMDALFKGDSVINSICISLCYKWSDPVYYKICQYGHYYFKNKRMCKWCCCCPHVN